MLLNVAYADLIFFPYLILAEQIKYKPKLCRASSLRLKNLQNIAQNLALSTYSTKTLQHNSPVVECIKPLDNV